MTATIEEATGFVVATNPNLGDDIIDRIVAIRPLRRDVVETKLGLSEATYSQVVSVDEDGSATDHGEHPIFWTVVRRQLEGATEQRPWVVGRLIRSGQAYRLESELMEVELIAVSRALRDLAGE